MAKRILYLGLDPSHCPVKGQIIHFPVIEIVPQPLSDPELCKALLQFATYSHIIITSKSTVSLLCDFLSQMGFSPSCWKNKTVIAVGQVTAKNLQKMGIPPAFIAQEECAEGIVDILKTLISEEAHFFWPHSAKARPLIQEFLVKNNARITDCVLYTPKTRNIDPLPQIDDIDEIIFTSPSTVDAFLELFGRLPVDLKLTPIGPITHQKLLAHLHPVKSSNL